MYFEKKKLNTFIKIENQSTNQTNHLIKNKTSSFSKQPYKEHNLIFLSSLLIMSFRQFIVVINNESIVV